VARGLGIRGKLILIATALTGVVLVPGGVFLEAQLRREVTGRIDHELEAYAVAARIAVDRADPGELPALADALGRATGRRPTIVAADGRVLGDSEVPAAELPALASHADRPEIRAAREGGPGRARRASATVRAEQRYVALPLADGRVVRVAQGLEAVDAAVRRQRVLVSLAALIALGVAAAVAGVASQAVAGSLRRLVASTRTLAGGRDAGDHPDDGKVDRGPTDELERTFKLLASERERSRAVLESMSDAVIALDRDHAITLVNRAARELLAIDDAALGRSLLELVRAPALQDLLAPGGEPRSAEFELPGSQRRVLASATPAHSPDGVVLVLHDVTTLRRLETVRRDFVANVSHELRTPISIVSANAETLLSGALDDAASAPGLVEAIYRNAERLGRIIDDLLDLSRLEAGKYDVAIGEVELAAAARRAIEAVAAKAKRRGTDLAIELDPDAVALADRDALHQVLVNLLDNAIKYTQDGGHVVVTGARRDGRARLEVRDDGPGIAPAHRERIFERFYRIDPGRSRDMGGTGLGLSIVKHMVEAMDGKIGLASNHPRGAIFWIELPAPG
jgi:two-component system, OmpR family, phosphate regulon sensor histidine kinase PhoR